MKLEIKVPATSANLGPGFDSLGMAFNLYNVFYITKSEEYDFINVVDYYCNENNLIIIAAKKTYQYLGKKEIKFTIEENVSIPISRGLGSSSTCIICGIVAASIFSGIELPNEIILKIGLEIENHPDNLVPCLLGGFACSMINPLKYYKYEVSEKLFFVAISPEAVVQTRKARDVLPDAISYSDCVYSLSRAINLPAALNKGDLFDLFELTKDRIHTPYRKSLIAQYKALEAISTKHRLPFFISGSGSTTIFIIDDLDQLKIFDDFKDKLRVLKVSPTGLEVKRLL